MKQKLPMNWTILLSVLLLLSVVAYGQDRTITGSITSSTDQTGLPGVNILIQGTTQGTTSDTDGNYSLSVPADASSLVFSFVGYKSQVVVIGNRSVIDVGMEEDIAALQEIVVTGYGTQEKANVTGAISSLPDGIIESRPIISADQALAGTVAGVNIVNRSGDPGAPISVRIRGVGTVGVNQPLWVIDGVPIVQTTNITVNTSSTTDSNPLAGINPDDIESMDVLKDASAAAIYGSRAANGVIIITTKRGVEGRTKVTYNGYAGSGQIRKTVDVLNVDQYIDVQTELGRDVSQFRGMPNVDWQDLVYRTAPMQSHNVSVSGGSEYANFHVSGGYLRQQGIEFGQDFERYTVKVNSDIKAGSRWSFGESILLSLTDRLTQSEGVGDCCHAAFNSSLNAPYFPAFDPNGPFGYQQETQAAIGEGSALNLLYRTDTRVNETRIKSSKVLGNLYGEFEIIEGLKFRMEGGFDYNVGDAFFFQERVDWGDSNIRDSRLIQSRPIELTTNWANTLTYTRSFGDHNLNVLVGYEETNFRFDKVRLQGNTLFNSAVKFASVASQTSAGNEADHWALKGLLGRINYDYQGKYLATVNIRRDETSRFAEGNRSDVFPSISVGWRLSEESFFPQGNFIDDFKLRVGYGEAGNQFTGVNFAFLSALQTTIFYVLGDNSGGQNVVRGPAPVNFANAALKWETSTSTDIGFDASLLEGKIDFSFDYWDKTSKDVLIGLPLPYVSGYFLPADANLGEIKNSGIELSIDYRNQSGDWTWGAGGNITTVKNEVKDLGSVPSIITGTGGGQTHRTIVGESVGHFYGYLTDGIFQNQGEIDAAPPDLFSGGREPGDIRFKDVNGDGVVDADDRTIMGSPIPGFFYGMYFNAGFKGFDLDIQLRGVGDVQLYNQARSSWENLSGNNNFTTTTLDRWTGPGTSNTMPRLSRFDPNGNNRYSDRWIEDADFLRIQTIQLSYTLPSTLLSKTDFISSVKVYVGVNNIATFTSYSGFDPEVGRAQSFQKGEFPLATGQDGGASPQPTIWRFGWTIGF
ncbi:MAG: SusC/RagA family TonB-linked outer membrane protein [Cyclobacteriaceae bacterium]|nr:MAG: SusC/RagA family TonB-linked outer membrane protein [Cyclobacteriaceae bacterium]